MLPCLTSCRKKSEDSPTEPADSQQRDAVAYEPGQIVELYRMAKGSCSQRSCRKPFKSGERWEVLRREQGGVIVGNGGIEKQVPLEQARNFRVFGA
jgi:hypothetical protein